MSTTISRRTLLKVAAFAAGSTALSACGVQGGSPIPTTSGSPKPTTTGRLQYPSWQFSEAGVGDYWRDSFAEFTKRNPGWAIDATQIGASDYVDKMVTQVGSGAAPDIMPMFTGNMAQFIKSDVLTPLDEYFANASWINQELPLFQFGSRDGKHYGIVQTASPYGLLYNKRLLEAAGVSVPTTSEEFLAACLAVKAKTGAWGYAAPTDTAEVLDTYIVTMQWVLGFGGDWANAQGKATADSPETVAGMRAFQALLDAKVVPQGMNVENNRALFKDGKAAFMIDGPWSLTFVKTENPPLYKDMGYGAPPTPTQAAITGGAFMTLPKAGKNQEAAWSYLAMINEEAWQRRWLEELVQLPGQSIAPSEAALVAHPWLADMVAVAAKSQTGFGYAPPSPALAPYVSQLQNIVMSHVAKIWTGAASVEDGLRSCQEDLEGWISELNV